MFRHAAVVFIGKAKSGVDLFSQKAVEAFDVDADVVSDGMLVDRGLAVKAGKQDGTAKFYCFAQHFSRGERVAVLVLVEQAFRGRGFGQLRDGLCQKMREVQMTH